MAVGTGVAVDVGVRVFVGVLLGTGVAVANSSAGDEQDKMEKINTITTVHKLSLFMFFKAPSRI